MEAIVLEAMDILNNLNHKEYKSLYIPLSEDRILLLYFSKIEYLV